MEVNKMTNLEIIKQRIRDDYTRPGQTAEPVFDTMLSATKYLTVWKITNNDGECYAVHQNSEKLDAFETREEADSFTKEWFDSQINLYL